MAHLHLEHHLVRLVEAACVAEGEVPLVEIEEGEVTRGAGCQVMSLAGSCGTAIASWPTGRTPIISSPDSKNWMSM